MERNQQTILPQKSSSFSTSTREEKLRDTDRNLSLGSIRLDTCERKERDLERDHPIAEESNENGEETAEQDAETKDEEAKDSIPDFTTLSDGIDQFLGILLSLKDDPDSEPGSSPELPESVVENFLAAVEKEIAKYESGEEKWVHHDPNHDEISLLAAVDRVSKLTTALTAYSSYPNYAGAVNRSGSVLHHAMSFLEDELHSLLEESRPKTDSKIKRPPSFSHNQEADHCVLPSAESSGGETTPTLPQETVESLHAITDVMMSSGYVTECCQVFTIARRNAFESCLSALGYEKSSIDEVLKMVWDSLEGEIATWIKVFHHAITTSFAHEGDLCGQVFANHRDIAHGIFSNFARGVVVQLLNFAEAVGMTKRSAEKLFKVLDMYEALRDSIPVIESFFPDEEEDGDRKSSVITDIKSELASVQSRLGEAAVAIFCDLESSIKTDTGKTPVPGGAVHPLTRYVMNYLKYACEYKNTLEQVFKEHQKPTSYNDESENSQPAQSHPPRRIDSHNPFASQMMEVMDLLHSNLEAKSKLYKDLALSNIFLMNNGRYVVQKIKGSAEINALLGDLWGRKRSSDLRQYHKNYQRETWSRVLACFKDDGLTVKGNVSKPVLKERFKNFNSLFEEIHKTQSSWVVSDEQLQSELRVSVSAVVVPAYRSFLGRFSQYLDPGRQTEKYIKFGPDDLETYIDELFDGNPTSMARRRT
ncbi:exocyst complex component EXO70C1-like [Typha angustifolia]|uniref:exocyst complex component EXO70C1-like n=1 Tax=Typha angustifolia TaxID=59011 RepID=UPI003C2D3583